MGRIKDLGSRYPAQLLRWLGWGVADARALASRSVHAGTVHEWGCAAMGENQVGRGARARLLRSRRAAADRRAWRRSMNSVDVPWGRVQPGANALSVASSVDGVAPQSDLAAAAWLYAWAQEGLRASEVAVPAVWIAPG